VANQAVAKSEDAALALCKLHGQINANVIIEGASLVQSGEGADAHSLLASEVRKTALVAPFMYKNEHFTKTGSGQTQGKLQKRVAFCAGPHPHEEERH
jgi:hypothetical protein